MTAAPGRRRTSSPSPSTASRSRCPRARCSSGPPSSWASRSRASATTRCSTRPAPAASAWSRSPTWATAAACPSRPRRAPPRSCPAWSIKTQLTSVGRRQGAAGRHGAAAHQPPARLPGLRQGRRVPAAEPGDEQRPRRVAASTRPSARSPSRSRSARNVLLDRERCVLCQRCTRFSLQIAGDPFIDLLERGAQQQIGTSDEQPFQSYFSGNTVQICPVGALTGASYRFRARPVRPHVDRLDLRALLVGLRAAHRLAPLARSPAAWPATTRRSTRSGTATRVAGPSTTPTQPDRILTPLVRNADGELVEASWPEALERAAQGLRRGRRPRRRRRAARRPAHRGGRLRLRQVRPRRPRHQRHRRPHPPGQRRGARLPRRARRRRRGPEHVSYADLETAPAVLLAGFEPEEESPIVFLRLRKATREHGTPGVLGRAAAPRAG